MLAPLGRLDRATVAGLATLVAEVRLSAARTLTVVDVCASEAPALIGALAALGLAGVDVPGWRGLSACAGLGACARALADVRSAATARAEVRGAGAPIEHWSACERDCGRPADVEISVVATADGLKVQARP
jgi:sulfite reductase beta subunit-like hemoprotein